MWNGLFVSTWENLICFVTVVLSLRPQIIQIWFSADSSGN